jgi:hypothetical protein
MEPKFDFETSAVRRPSLGSREAATSPAGPAPDDDGVVALAHRNPPLRPRLRRRIRATTATVSSTPAARPAPTPSTTPMAMLPASAASTGTAAQAEHREGRHGERGKAALRRGVL